MDYIIEKVGRIAQITPIPVGFLAERLEKKLSYIRDGAQFMQNPLWAVVKLYRIKTGRFPWGLIELVKEELENWTTISKDSFRILRPKIEQIDNERFKTLNTNLRDYQKDAILQLIINGGGVVSLPTGAGKTFVAIEYIKLINKQTLIIVPTLDLKQQWEKQIPINCTVMTYQSIKDYNILDKYGLIIFEECHHAPSKSIYNIAMKCHNSILVGLSATPFREDKEDMKIIAALGEIIYVIDRKTLISQGFLSDATIYYIDHKNHTKDKFLGYPEIYKNFIVLNNDRNECIIDIVKKNYLIKKILILVSQIEHGAILFNKLKGNNLESRFLNGSSEVIDRLISKEDKVIIATSIFDEGVDVPDFDLLILAAGGKSSIKVTQRIGRILRMKPGKHAIIYDFIDNSRYLIKHYKRRREILAKDFNIFDEEKIYKQI